jgi:taurine dioxygenase
MGISVTPLAPALGAEIRGVDLSEALDAETVAAIEDAWHAHIVLVFRDQDLEPEDQVRFSEYFGGPAERTLPQDRTPEGERADRRIALVTNMRREGQQVEHLNEGDFWFHHDGCFNEKPYKGTVLYGVTIPSRGGNTVFSNNYMAYDRLPEDMKARLKGLTCLQIYDFAMRGRVDAEGDLARYRHARQPVAITHPATGRKALYVNPLMTARIEGLPEDESEALLAELCRYTEDRDLMYEHVWRPGDVVVTDNWCSAHARTDFPNEEYRLLRRSMIAGQALAE